MKARTRKKYACVKCKHLYDEYNEMGGDPYIFYDREIYCKLNPEIEFPEDFEPSPNDGICSKCKGFCPSRQLMKEYNRWGRDSKKEQQRYYQKNPIEWREVKEWEKEKWKHKDDDDFNLFLEFPPSPIRII